MKKTTLIFGILLIFTFFGFIWFIQTPSLSSSLDETNIQTKVSSSSVSDSNGEKPVIHTLSPNSVQTGSFITITGLHFGNWIQPQEFPLPGGNYPIEIFITDIQGREQLVWATDTGDDILKTDDNKDTISIIIDKNPCVPTSANECSFGAFEITPGKYSITLSVQGLRSEPFSMIILPLNN